MSKRTRFTPNEILVMEDHAEIVLYDRNSIKKAISKIDLEDIEKIKKYKWSCTKGGRGIKYYAQTISQNRCLKLHRYLLDYCGELDIDHIDGDTLNNRKSNLRIVSHQENMQNQKIRSGNKTGYTGVYFNNINKVYVAQIKVNYRMIYLGSFKNIEDAIKERKLAELEYFQHKDIENGY